MTKINQKQNLAVDEELGSISFEIINLVRVYSKPVLNVLRKKSLFLKSFLCGIDRIKVLFWCKWS